MIKWILYFLALVSLILSLYWGITQNQSLEPWTAFISAILFFIGLFSQNNKSGSKNFQKNFLSFFSTSRMKNPKGNNSQTNFFGVGNTQEIEHSSNIDDEVKDENNNTTKDV